MSGLVRLLLLLLLGFCAPVRARADAHERVLVEGCAGVRARELEELLALELGTLGTSLGEVQGLRVVCHGLGATVWAVLPPARMVTTEVSLQEQRESLTRLLALRISELLTTSLAVAPPDPPVVTGPPVVESTPVSGPRHDVEQKAVRAYPQTSFTLGTRYMGKPATWLYGLTFGQQLPLFWRITLYAELNAELGVAQAKVTEVAWRQLGVGFAVLWSERRRHADVHLGPGFRVAYSWLSARDQRPDQEGQSMSAPWAGSFATLLLGLHGQRSQWQGVVGLEAGFVSVPVRGLLDDVRSVLSIDGAFFALQLGTGRRF